MISHTETLYSGTISASGNTTAKPVKTSYDTEAIIYLDITDVKGTNPTLDISIKIYDSVSAKWYELADFDQKTEVGSDVGFIEYGLNDKMAVYYVIGGTNNPSFTCTISVCLKDA